MSKPYGITAGLKIRKPSRVEDKIWDAVEEAIDSGWTAKQFRDEAADAWYERLHYDAKAARKALQEPTP